MQNISIAFFVWGLSSDAITNIAAALAQGFLKLGVQEMYVIYLNGSVEENTSFPKEVKFVHLGVHRARQSPLPIKRFLDSTKPDFLISLAFLNIPAILGWMLTNRSSKLVISQQNTLIYKAQIEHKGELLMQSQLWLAQFLYSRVNGLVATTQLLLEEIVQQVGVSLPQKQITSIPNPVNLELIIQQAQDPIDHPWLQNKEQPVILSVARLAKQKNFPLLLHAFLKLRQQLDAKLIIVGEGSERQTLEKLIEELGLEQDVSLAGESKNPWSYMSRADVFVLSSEEEAFGLVLVEAMACGLPIVATDAIAGGPRSILSDNQYGLLVPNRDVDALTDALVKVLTLPDLRNQLVDAGTERCKAFAPDKIANQWLTFLEQL